MATEASLDGISQFGLKWKASVKINLPKDIPSLFEETETPIDVITLGHNISKNLIASLKRIDWTRQWDAPKDESFVWMKEQLAFLIQELDETFVVEEIDRLQDWDEEVLSCSADGLEDELIYRLEELYDWADYWRVCLSSNS